MTDAERRLWRHLRLCQLDGCKFRRQAPIGDYIVDFVCFEKRLVVELDGGQHTVQREYDAERTRWPSERGLRVLRFWNHEVFEDLEPVLEAIWNALRDGASVSTTPCQPPTPTLPRADGGREPDGRGEPCSV
jgi:very-short-patch-repair endonuclease